MSQLVERLCVTVEAELQASASRDPVLAPLGMWNGLGGIVGAIAQLEQGTPSTAQSERACRRYLEVVRQFVSLDRTPPDQGMFSGRVGLLLCASAAAEFIDSETDRAWVRAVTVQFCTHVLHHPIPWLDFGAGVAGLICGVISLAKRHDIECRALVENLSRQLVRHLELTPLGVSLHHERIETTGPLCGLAHGLSGLAVALLDAGLYLRSEMLERLAETVLNTELQLKHPERLWPDTRIMMSPDSDPERLAAARRKNEMWKSASITWCYGTSGLGLALAFFAERKKSMQHRHLCEAVIDDTLGYLHRQGGREKEFCVCHGVGSVLALLNSSKVQRSRVLACRASYLPEVDEILRVAGAEETPAPLVSQAFRSYGLPKTTHPAIVRASFFTGMSGLAVVRDQITRATQPYMLSLPVSL